MKSRSALQQKKFDRILSDAKGVSPFGPPYAYQTRPVCEICGRARTTKAHRAHPPVPPRTDS